jgi:predicted PurR-regulated permease PerM
MEHRPPPARWAPVPLAAEDACPASAPDEFWNAATQAAIIGTFLVLLLASLNYARPVLLPVALALVLGTILGPISNFAARVGIPPWASGVLLVLGLFAGVSFAIVSLSDPVRDWIGRAPEIGAALKDKLQLLDWPLAALNNLRESISGPQDAAPNQSPLKIDLLSGLLQPALAVLTPAAAQLLIFFGTLFFFLAGRARLRQQFVRFSDRREGRLRALRMLSDFESNLASYFATVTVINAALGCLLAGVTYLVGLPSPLVWGMLAFLLNFVPYLGAAATIAMLFAVGLIAFASVAHALIAPAAYLILATIEGQFITPAIVGRRLTLNPLFVFLSVAFWAWLWGPFGALLGVPVLIISMVALSHLFPKEAVDLPG